MDTSNPYRPPLPAPHTSRNQSRGRVAYLAPATLSVGFTLLLWVAFVSMLGRSVGPRFDMLFWAFSLILASTISTAGITRLWRSETHPMAFGVTFSTFGMVFGLLEGDTSNGTDLGQRTIVYGTLLMLPVAMYLLTRWISGFGRYTAQPSSGG